MIINYTINLYYNLALMDTTTQQTNLLQIDNQPIVPQRSIILDTCTAAQVISQTPIVNNLNSNVSSVNSSAIVDDTNTLDILNNTSDETSNEYVIETHDYCTKDNCIVNKHLYCVANFCISCGINIGDCNPRQLCGKTYCYFNDT